MTESRQFPIYLILIGYTLFFLFLSSRSASAQYVFPPTTTSLYMNTVNTTTAYNLGCVQGKKDLDQPGTQDGVVILDFGTPLSKIQNGQTLYGANLLVGAFATTTQIAAAAVQFARGYYICTGSDYFSHIYLVVGTSNYGTQGSTSHGKAWAQMLQNIGQQLVDNGYIAQTTPAGGVDAETSWNSPATTKAWVNGYTSAWAGTWLLFNFGDAGGCPRSGTTQTPGACNNKWSQDDVWFASWGADPAVPLPEIYATSGANAKQWQQLSLYSSLRYGGPMSISGALTEQQACQQRGGCKGVDNSPQTGWQQLLEALQSDSRTSQNLPWSTDIRWR